MSANPPSSPEVTLWRLLLIVNGGWIAFVAAAHTILPQSFGDPHGWPRAVVRSAVLLLPALMYLARFEHGAWAVRLGLQPNCRRGLIVGGAVALLWFAPQAIIRWTSGAAGCDAVLTAGVWLNAIVGSPFAEELLYRQIVFRRLSERLPLWKAVCGSALWFTLLHVPAAAVSTTSVELAQHLSVIFVYGVVFACLYAVSQSLWGAWIPHVANNAVYAVVAAQ